MNKYRPIIIGLSGYSLTASERAWLGELQPYGVIFFSRNIENAIQVKALIQDLQSILGKDVAIFVDQEGGRVQRMKSPNWPNLPTPLTIGGLWRRHQFLGLEAAHCQGQIIGSMLAEVGINHVCAPCVDLLYADANSVIGDRSFGHSPAEVIPLASAFIDGVQRTGVKPILKHIPGMGRVKLDSHDALPTINTPVATLRETDWLPFKQIPGVSMVMTAHVVIPEWDNKPVTISTEAINQIRLEFPDRLIISDCLTMGALEGNVSDRVRNTLTAGVDLALFSNGGETARREAVLAVDRFRITREASQDLKPLPLFHIERCLEKLKSFSNPKVMKADPTHDQTQ